MKTLKKVILPDLGEGIESATISEVSVSKGQKINKDNIILVLESDKASMEIPSEVSGTIKSIDIKKGQEVKTGDLLITIETADTTNEASKEKQPPEAKPEAKPAVQSPQNTPQEQQERSGDGVYASPGVRRLARELNINLSTLSGSGSKGRITKNDLHAYIKAQMYSKNLPNIYSQQETDFSQWGDINVKKLTKIKTITGKRLSSAWQTIPHVTQFVEADVTELESVRKKQKDKHIKDGIKITMMPYLMKAAVNVLKTHPVFNSSIQNDGLNIVFKKYYNIGVAVDTKDGLVVPVIKNVDKKDIVQLSKELMDISERARNKQLLIDELKGGTFTISNLGGIGGSFFTPIINPPEVAILGVSRTKIENNGKLTLPLSLSYDHRVIDGAAGAAFVVLLSNVLSNAKKLK
jgi:pyruvate dehydrogenase E2 component (dihydrolipoamide acetyltransferase)